MTQEEITKRQLRMALIADWEATVSSCDRVLIIDFCARDIEEHVPLSTVKNILPRLYAISQTLQHDLEVLRRNVPSLSRFAIDDIVRMLVNEVVNVQIDWMRLIDIDDYD